MFWIYLKGNPTWEWYFFFHLKINIMLDCTQPKKPVTPTKVLVSANGVIMTQEDANDWDHK